MSVTTLDIIYTLIIADLLTVLQGARAEAIAYRFIDFKSNNILIFSLGVLLLIRFVLNDQIYLKLNKIIYSIYQTKVNRSISSRLQNVSSAEIFDEPGRAVKNYSTDINIFIGGFLGPLVQLSIDFSVILALIVYACLYIQFDLGFVSILLVSVIFLSIILRKLSQKAKLYGHARNDVDGVKARLLSEFPGSWRSLIDLKAEAFFIRKLSVLNQKYSSASVSIARNVNLTKMTIETYVGLVLVGSCFLISGKIDYSTASLSVAVAIFMRIFPTINRCAQAIMIIRSCAGALESLNDDSGKVLTTSKFDIVEGPKNILIKKCEIHKNNTKIVACENINIPKNQLTVISAPSGTGKSVFLRALYQELKKKSERVAYIPQNFNLFTATLSENIFLDENINNKEKVISVLERVGFTKKKSIEIFDDDKLVTSLSGGESQRIFIARYLVQHFDYLLMDEVTSALDSEIEMQVIELVKVLSKESTIIINSHSPQIKASNINHIELMRHLT